VFFYYGFFYEYVDVIFVMPASIYHQDGIEMLKSQKWDHIITDPDYVNQPNSDIYKEQCTGNIVVFCDPTLRPKGGDPNEVLFWTKPISTRWSTKRCNKFVEEILVYRGKTSTFNTIHWSSMTGVFSDGFISKPKHPYTKPVTLMEKLVLMYTNPGDTIFDPFSGSGTTAVAAIRHGRNFVGCEINQIFYEEACERIGNLKKEIGMED